MITVPGEVFHGNTSLQTRRHASIKAALSVKRMRAARLAQLTPHQVQIYDQERDCGTPPDEALRRAMAVNP